jgi:hypothetical protein
LKDRHFDTIEVIVVESEAVQNTLTEHDLQDALKTWQSTGNLYTRGKRLLGGLVVS